MQQKMLDNTTRIRVGSDPRSVIEISGREILYYRQFQNGPDLEPIEVGFRKDMGSVEGQQFMSMMREFDDKLDAWVANVLTHKHLVDIGEAVEMDTPTD